MTLKEKIAQRASVWDQMKALMAATDGRSMTGEEISSYEALETDLDRLGREIGADQRHAKHAAALDKIETDPIVNPGDGQRSNADAYRDAFNLWLKNGMVELDADQRAVLRAGKVDDKELRAQGVGTPGGGGFLVPEDYRDRLIEVTKFFGAVQQVAEVITTDTGAVLPWPTLNDTANKGAILGENVVITDLDVTLTEAQLTAFKYTSLQTKVSWELVQDDAFNLSQRLPRLHGERIGRIWNEHFTTGTGVNQPEGIQTNAVVGVTGLAGQTTSITYDNIIDLEHSLDISYRNERASFMFHDTVLASLRKIKDADGRPLWQPSLQAGVADRFNGRPYVINNDMPVPAASVKSVLFGDFVAGYVIRIVRGVQAIRLDERYADAMQTGFFSFARADARIQNPSAYRAYRQAAA